MPTRICLIAIAALAGFNGVYNPALLPHSTGMAIVFTMGLVNAYVSVVVFIAFVLGAILTVMLAGVPAALFERINGQPHSTRGSLAIWLGATVVLTLPALTAFLQVGGF